MDTGEKPSSPALVHCGFSAGLHNSAATFISHCHGCDEYSKRVYQGVRVKHTVKDLLAEKRSRQTSGPRYSGGATTPPSFVQMSGSHMLPSYYGMRRPYISDSDYCPSSAKQFTADIYGSGMGSKALGCDPSSVSGYSSLIDCYYPETFGDYRSATAAFSTTAASSIFPSIPSSLLTPFGGETSHLFLRETWDQSAPEPLSQVGDGLCPDGLSTVVGVTSASVTSPEPEGSPAHQHQHQQYRSPSHGSSAMGPSSSSTASPYALHTLEDVHYHPLSTSSYPPSSPSFSCSPYMSGTVGDLASKMAPLAPEEAESHRGLASHSDAHHPSWAKEDAGSSWSSYEIRRY
ncbi:hypothetical protein N1851_017509 [Merluccius polli]|uniref:OCA domain-containing protein n=1 Tax=Merluccius polli TaxID=89951 RepID=A0AA47MPL2_MERPO|nr:hypothetical protein N1851_017509 [Merluccius polli]